MKNSLANMAVQLLPLSYKDGTSPYGIIDKVIGIISSSGLTYRVCPYETVIEGTFNDLMALLKDIQTEAFESGAREIIINIKFHAAADKDVTINDKMEKYDDEG